jgi:hypothetical protein
VFNPIEELVAHFDVYHFYFQKHVAPGWQVPNLHRQALALRGDRPAISAIQDVGFMSSLRGALSNDFGLARTGLHNPLVIAPGLFPAIQQLDGVRLEDASADTLRVLWDMVEGLQFNEAQAKLVVNTKALAHVLTELVVPIDRTYTGAFLLRFPGEFDGVSRDILRTNEKQIFYLAFSAFRWIAQRVDLAKYISIADDWNTTKPKVIDNAIIGFVEYIRAELAARR